MAKSNVEKYIDELRGIESEEKDTDLYSLKKELLSLNQDSKIFDNFEKEAMSINKETLNQVQDLNLLLKIRNLASELKNKKEISNKLHSLHFNLNLLKNASDFSAVKNALNSLLYNKDTQIENIINELNDFKSKLEKIKNYHLKLLPKSLDNKLEIEGKYNRHMESLHSIHKRQKEVFISTVKLFLKLAKKHIKTLQKFKKRD